MTAKEALKMNLTHLMEQHSLSYSDLGDKFGVSKQQIWNLINGDSWISMPTLEKLAKAFKIEETDLFDPNFSERYVKSKRLK